MQQLNHGKDSVSLHVLKDRLSATVTKWESKIGYLNYLHSVDLLYDALPNRPRALLDVHVNK